KPADPPSAVTFNHTALASLRTRAGPATGSASGWPAPSAPTPSISRSKVTCSAPIRVSSTRAGSTVDTGDSPDTYPLTSTTTSAGAELKMHAAPPSPSLASTAFDSTPPRTKFTFDVHGRWDPHGNSDRKPSDPPSAVTFSHTALA